MTARDLFHVEPIPDATFGAIVRLREGIGAATMVSALEAEPGFLPGEMDRVEGFLVLRGFDAITEEPELLLRLSRLFGEEVENYRQTLTQAHMIHPQVDEILVLSNLPPFTRLPPAPPDPPLTEGGKLTMQFPHRRGWHTDQSFRRPPPDVSLFYAVVPSPKGQGQTLFANGIAAYEALPPGLKSRADTLTGLHALLGTGRSEYARKADDPIKPLLAHQRSQEQPVVRVHPVTGRRALYLCEAGQMDWLDGPFVGLEPGPDGEGAEILYALMSHYTSAPFTYAHDWDAGDVAIYDNRSLIHSATWYDADAHTRLMWRTTVRGNPGPEYDGEAWSWGPVGNESPMDGLTHDWDGKPLLVDGEGKAVEPPGGGA